MEELEEALRNPFLLLIVPGILFFAVMGIVSLIEQKMDGGNK